MIDKAHSLVLQVLIDMVHSHASNNLTDGLNGYDIGQRTEESTSTLERGDTTSCGIVVYLTMEIQKVL